MANSTDFLLATFLRSVADKVEKGKITGNQYESITNFFMSFLTDKRRKSRKGNEYSEFMQFFTVGWYVYTQLLEGVE